MTWSETMIARALALQFFNRKNLVVVPNCSWPGSECDLLVVTENLRIIDVEIKISRADLKADAKKDKWWRYLTYEEKVAQRLDPKSDDWWGAKEAVQWPNKVWKHYYALPADIWKPELADALPSQASGVLLLRTQSHDGPLIVTCERRATPCRDAETVSPAAAIDIARLASLRMWDSFLQVDQMRRERERAVV